MLNAFSSAFVHRYCDLDQNICAECVKAVGSVGEQTVRYSFTTLTTLATPHFLFRTQRAVTRTPLVFSPSSLVPRRLEVSHFIATLF